MNGSPMNRNRRGAGPTGVTRKKGRSPPRRSLFRDEVVDDPPRLRVRDGASVPLLHPRHGRGPARPVLVRSQRTAKTAPTRFPFIVSPPGRALSSLSVRGGEVLEDLRGIRVGDPVRLLPLHLLDGRRPLLLGRGR